jgi:hypothetical protein
MLTLSSSMLTCGYDARYSFMNLDENKDKIA